MKTIYYCPFIDHQITVDFGNKIKPCCQFEELHEYSEYHDKIKIYKEKMLNGEKIKPCRQCWHDESLCFPSLRQSALNDFKKYSNPQGLMVLDIRINNDCNLACTMCSDNASTLWSKLFKSNRKLSLSDELKNELIKNSNNLVELSMQGGEPFYGNAFINFVEQIPNKSNIKLTIFTNVITTNVDLVEKWTQQFKHVDLFLSVDGMEETYENIRWPAKWKKVELKIKELYKLRKNINNLVCNFAFTFQNLNILNLYDFFNWRNDNCPLFQIIINKLENPPWFHFLVLNTDEKHKALNLLSQIETPYKEEKEKLLYIINALQSSALRTELLNKKDQSLREINNLRTNYNNGAASRDCT